MKFKLKYLLLVFTFFPIVSGLETFLICNCFAEIRYVSKTGTSTPPYIPDTTKERPTQYRRGIGLKEDYSQRDYQTYKEKYTGKILNEIKRSLFPDKGGAGVWTELNPKVPRVDYIGINFVNKDTGWAVGDLGALIKTIDGGESWKTIETNTTLPILKVRSINGQLVIAGGYDGLILRSIDSGETFEQVSSGATGDLWGLEIVNDTLGWACGATALLKTTDGGENWQMVNIPGYAGNLWSVEFLNENYGFIAADGKVLRTTNGGDNWEIIQAGDDQSLYIVDIIDSLHIAAAGYGGTSYRGKNLYSSDGGYTWINGGPTTFEPINDIKYVNRDTGYIVMNNTIAKKTTNRGQEWTGIQAAGEWEMQFFKEENIGYSAGTGLRIYKTENGYENWQRLIINDNFSDVFFVNEEEGFAISGVLSVFQGLYKTTDGGINWKGVAGPSGQDILFLDNLTGFIGSNVIYKTTDGGETWYIPNGGQGGAGRIFFINETIGWAIRSNIINKTTDKGENWFIQYSAPSSISFDGINFVDTLCGWTANLGGRPYKTTNGGVSWSQQTNLDIWESRDVFFKDCFNGFLIESDKLYKTTNGGMSFNLIPGITGFIFAKFSNYADSIIFITGYKSYRSIDGGNSWVNFSELDGIRINSLNLLEPGLGYAAGEYGLIIKYYDSSYTNVEINALSLEKVDSSVVLHFITSVEYGNYGFDIERSDSLNNWEKIGFVPAQNSPADYSFEDTSIVSNGTYYYRLKQIDVFGKFKYYPNTSGIKIYIGFITSVGNENQALNDFRLYQNYPNPFNSSTVIKYQIPQKDFVNISLYDIKGEKIIELLNDEKEQGKYTVSLENIKLPSGIYFVRMITSAGYSALIKITLIK